MAMLRRNINLGQSHTGSGFWPTHWCDSSYWRITMISGEREKSLQFWVSFSVGVSIAIAGYLLDSLYPNLRGPFGVDLLDGATVFLAYTLGMGQGYVMGKRRV